MSKSFAKIISVERNAQESENHIVTTYLKLKLNSTELEAFVPLWRRYFSYNPLSRWTKKYGLGQELINNLIGKKISGRWVLNNLEKPRKLQDKYRDIKQINKSAEQTLVQGIVQEFSEVNAAKIDCRLFLIESTLDQEKFSVGDYVELKGRLDIHLEKIEEKYLRKNEN